MTGKRAGTPPDGDSPPEARDKPRSRQAAWLAAQRAKAGGAVTFIPRDKAELDAAIAESGKTQHQWLLDAVDNQIARQRKQRSE